jgi:hypothetical protein
MTVSGSEIQRRSSADVPRILVCTTDQERLDNFQRTVSGSFMQRRLFVTVLRIIISTTVQKRLDSLKVTVLSSKKLLIWIAPAGKGGVCKTH